MEGSEENVNSVVENVPTDSAFPRITYVESDLEFETDKSEVGEVISSYLF